MPETTIFLARKVITMDPNVPDANAIAVRDGRILSAGPFDRVLSAAGGASVDRQFASQVILPGFVEAHAHILEGIFWQFPYVGFIDRRRPDGATAEGATTNEAIVTRLRRAAAAMPDPNAPLFAWGYDPLFLKDEELTARVLDTVFATRPIYVMHASGHVAAVNSALLEAGEITATTNVEGVVKWADGNPTGVLQETKAMNLGLRVAGSPFAGDLRQPLLNLGRAAHLAGVTTVTDLGTLPLANPASLDRITEVTSSDEFPARLAAAHGLLFGSHSPGRVAEECLALKAKSTDKLRMGFAKILTDGSIQGFTARLRWPCYHNGAANGIWNVDPEALRAWVAELHRNRIQVHIHANGDEATDAALDALEAASRETPWDDHRLVLEHNQMATDAQFRRMKALGACTNLFANHIYYWGDIHRAVTIGPDRAARMDAAGSALRHGVPFSLHSDANVTPIGPLFAAWCAVNRRTMSGRILGQEQCIPVMDALRAVTLGAAYLLRLDDEIGSIETGKRADFTVLGEDPLAVDPLELKDVPVVATVLGGVARPVPAPPTAAAVF